MSEEKESLISSNANAKEVITCSSIDTIEGIYCNMGWRWTMDATPYSMFNAVSPDSRCRKEELPFKPLHSEDKQKAIAYLRELDLPVYASLDLENGGYRVVNNHSRVVMHLRGTVEKAELMVKLLNALPALLLA